MSQVSKNRYFLLRQISKFSDCCLLIYEVIVRYLKERKQFGAPLAAFQINQEKLSRMLGNLQAMVLMGWRLCKLYENGKMTAGQASLGKVILNSCTPPCSFHAKFSFVICSNMPKFQAWITLKARETVALGRELLGGNGILADFLVAKVIPF